MSLRDIFRRKKNTHKANYDGGSKLYGLWLMVLPVVMGFVLGRLADAGLGYGLDILAGDNGMSNATVTGTQSEASSGPERRGLDEFLAANPFKISPRKSDAPAPAPQKPKAEEPPQVPDTSLDDIILRGTLPGIGAWFDVKNELKLVLVGKNIDSYQLVGVEYGEVLFRKDKGKTVKKYIVYGPSPATAKKPEQKQSASQPPARPEKPAAPAKRETGNIVAAIPGSQEGQVPSELVSNLVQNPFDEMKRIRIRPNEKAGGLEVQWIQNDSLLKRLGVKRGDVIRSINGVPFTNMGDIANSINSLMNSERLDVEVTRGGENTALRYVVK